MNKMSKIYANLLKEISGLHDVPMGAYNIRSDSQVYDRKTTANIDIVTRENTEEPGIDIIIKPNTKGESVHIPVVIGRTGLDDMVYNDFYIGENADVTIIAGCGVHNPGEEESSHEGIHRFFVGKNAKVKYVEKHFGSGEGNGKRVINPVTEIEMDQGSYMFMDTVQIDGVDYTDRQTRAKLKADAQLIIEEKIMTTGKQEGYTNFEVDLDGENSSSHLVSRSVAQDESYQQFLSKMNGNNISQGHTECDAIIIGNGRVSAIPEIFANHPDSALIHEATIGKIAGEQLMKLKTLGLDDEQAEAQIISGFLK